MNVRAGHAKVAGGSKPPVRMTAPMIQPKPSRRAFAIGGAVTGAGAALAGAGLFITNNQAHSQYDELSRTTWGSGSDANLSPADKRVALVRYATLAANSHNTQPWRFNFADKSIFVAPDMTRRLSAVDPDDHHLYASLGCAAQNIVEAAPTFGMMARVNFDASARAIRIDLDAAPRAASPLFPAISQRQSTRSDFDGRPISPEHLRLLDAAGNGDGVRTFLLTEQKQREDILGYVVAGNRTQMDNPAFVDELKSWIRFNYAEALSKRDGLFSKCSGAPTLPSWFGRSMFSQVFKKDAENAKYQRQIRSSSGVAVFVSDKNEPGSWVQAGRSAQRFALQATALGLKHAFINQPVEVPAVRGQLASYLGVGDMRPDLVLRFGYGPDLPRSLRRPIEQVIVTS